MFLQALSKQQFEINEIEKMETRNYIIMRTT